MYIAQSPDTLNPLLATSVTTRRLAFLFYDPLVVPDADNRLRPALAAAVPTLANGGISHDGRTVTFKLRKGVRWQDGRPFTSADVIYSFAKINDPSAEVADRTGYDQIARVRAPDPFTVIVTLKEPFAPFVAEAGYGYPILPEHVVADTDYNRDPLRSQPVGTGPYRLRRWDRGNRIELVANAAYFGGRPRIKYVTIAELPNATTVSLALRTHVIDFAQVEPAVFMQLRERSDLRAGTEPANMYIGVALNTTSSILRDVRMRRALSMAIDRVRLCNTMTLGIGTPAYADLPAKLWSDSEPLNPYGYDPHAANAMLDAAGWTRGPSGFRERGGVSLRLRNVAIDTGYWDHSIAAQIEQMLGAVGIAWSTKFYSASQYVAPRERGGVLARGDYDTASFSGLGGIDSRNDEIYRCASREPFGSNAAFYCSARMDELQEDSLRTVYPARRAADVVNIEKLAVTDVPYIFLFNAPREFIWNRRLHRSRANVDNTWYDIAHWWLASR